MYVGLQGTCGQGVFEFQSFSGRGPPEGVEAQSCVRHNYDTPTKLG
jgi:hypothetical protein